MAKEVKKIENLRMEPATNGFVIRYTLCVRPYGGKDMYANSRYDSKEEVYKSEESKKAIQRFMELCEGQNGSQESMPEEKYEKDEY